LVLASVPGQTSLQSSFLSAARTKLCLARSASSAQGSAIGFDLCAEKLVSSKPFTERLFYKRAGQILTPAWSELKISSPIALMLVLLVSPVRSEFVSQFPVWIQRPSGQACDFLFSTLICVRAVTDFSRRLGTECAQPGITGAGASRGCRQSAGPTRSPLDCGRPPRLFLRQLSSLHVQDLLWPGFSGSPRE
jgi:hypothetical protein